LSARGFAGLVAAGAGLLALALGILPRALLGADAAEEEVRASFRRVLASQEARALMAIERSDPFGGEPSRENGSVWILPGRGLRYRSSASGGQEIVIDRQKELFLLYSPSERTVYRAPYSRAPARLRRLVAEPEQFLRARLDARAEPRSIRGRVRDGYRLRGGSLGDSLPEVSVWMSRDRGTGLPHWVSIASPTDTVWIEFRNWNLAARARPGDLALSAPPGTKEAPLDPRELLERGGGSGESR
jgi:hypothetical protein